MLNLHFRERRCRHLSVSFNGMNSALLPYYIFENRFKVTTNYYNCGIFVRKSLFGRIFSIFFSNFLSLFCHFFRKRLKVSRKAISFFTLLYPLWCHEGDGRMMGGWKRHPPMPSAQCTSAFQACHGRMGGWKRTKELVRRNVSDGAQSNGTFEPK